MEQAFRLFEELLRVRFQRGSYTTEDSIRYTFFHAALSTLGIPVDEVEMEAAHPTIVGARIDVVLPAAEKGTFSAVEFKYDRRGKSGSPMPLKAGALIHDFVRLAALPLAYRQRFAIYVSDDEMHSYFGRASARSRLAFYGAGVGKTVYFDSAYLADQSATLRNRAAGPLGFSVTLAHEADLHNGHHLRIFGVSATHDG